MASISPSTLIFTFCLTMELQIVVGTPTPWAQRQARNTHIVSENKKIRGPASPLGLAKMAGGGDASQHPFRRELVGDDVCRPYPRQCPC